MGERYDDIPTMALSVRQPWATCLALGWKDIENRRWRNGNPGLNFRGEFAIHASSGMTRDEYESCAEFCCALGFPCPPPADLLRGGIVGAATIVNIVSESDSPWFFGAKGLLIADAKPVDFIPVGGQLGFFNWKRLLPLASAEGPVPPAKWMLPDDVRPVRVSARRERDIRKYQQAMAELRAIPNSGDAE